MIKLLLLLAGRELRYRLLIYCGAVRRAAGMIVADVLVDGHINLSLQVLALLLSLSLLFNLLSGECRCGMAQSAVFPDFCRLAGRRAVAGDEKQLKKLLTVMEICLLFNGLFRCLSAALIQRQRWCDICWAAAR